MTSTEPLGPIVHFPFISLAAIKVLFDLIVHALLFVSAKVRKGPSLCFSTTFSVDGACILCNQLLLQFKATLYVC